MNNTWITLSVCDIYIFQFVSYAVVCVMYLLKLYISVYNKAKETSDRQFRISFVETGHTSFRILYFDEN